MALSNRDRVHRALDLLLEGLTPFVERQLEAAFGAGWRTIAADSLRQSNDWRKGDERYDVQALLLLMWNNWHEAFRQVLGHNERNLVSELRGVRNRDAHQEAFSTDDAYRALDSIQRLLLAVSAPQATEVDRMKQELLRARFEEQVRTETRRTSSVPTEGRPAAGLRPWREIVTPHSDVAAGNFEQAQFAADLNQVYQGQGSAEYRDPRDFFARTYITEGMRALLEDALRRLAGEGGDPVVELKTNFGGGKTHSMLALYHLFSGTPPGDLPGVEPLLHDVGVARPATARCTVLAGQALSPAEIRRKPDGTEVHTLWGEMAWQLLGADGYALVAAADQAGVSPGSDALAELFRRAAPCLVLIDEWVLYLRQLYHVSTLPAGSFDANLSFAQALTEAARATDRTLVVASLPTSKIEIGGEGGQAALDRLSDTFGRVESAWRPAGREEGFEIVRRRLFEPIAAEDFRARDAVVRAFSELYRTQASEFPAACREGEYERRMRTAYPIHPELFDCLYGAWSTLDRFQRTRGVLRLMAAVIHVLWERQDTGLLILPSSIPLDDPAVQTELTQYMEDPWVPVIETDVDGTGSLPLRLDRENPNLGRYSAARRVARTIFMASAPTVHTANKGVDDQHVKLGCDQPGESVATFGDALRRLTDAATHLYVDGRRYWYSTQPSVTRLAEERARLLDDGTVHAQIEELLRAERSGRDGPFRRIHICPESSADVPDEQEARLVILRPATPHTAHDAAGPARETAATILRERGASPRAFQNMLVFLAPDKNRLQELERAVRLSLAWESIVADSDSQTLLLDGFQTRQAKTKSGDAAQTVRRRVRETYCWVLAPEQDLGGDGIEWVEMRAQGDNSLAVRAARKLEPDELLITEFSATRLAMELNRVPLWRGDDVTLRQLWEDFCRYLYLPRLRDVNVLLEAIRQGVESLMWRESFGYAEAWDGESERYRGLYTGSHAPIVVDSQSRLVKPEVAALQRAVIERAEAPGSPWLPLPAETDGDQQPIPGTTVAGDGVPPPTSVIRRYHATAQLDPLRISSDARRLTEEVVEHLNALPGAKVRITLEIEADAPEGIPDRVVQIVSQNARDLKVESQGFEED